jgi:protein-tyrosine phosphatase
MKPIRICFVCLGNICRSPVAHGLMQHMIARDGLESSIFVDSAGTGSWHVGEAPHPCSVAVAAENGIELQHRAQQFKSASFDAYDLILAMDRQNLRDIRALARQSGDANKVVLFRTYDALLKPAQLAADAADVPDPYDRPMSAYRDMFEICERTCAGLLGALKRELNNHG